MTVEEKFDKLDEMLAARSSDYETMRAMLQDLKSRELARTMAPAQDRLYASISRGHRKVLQHLEINDVMAAKHETAKVIAWFYRKFHPFQPGTLVKYPAIGEELRKVHELAAKRAPLKDAISKSKGTDIHEP